MKAIDFRVRPPYDSFLGLFSYDKWPGDLVKGMKNLGFEDPLPASYQNGSVEEYLKEAEEAEIVVSVIAARAGADNDAFEELTVKYPGKFYFFPYVNLANLDETKKIAERYILNGKGYAKGVTVEPGIPIDGKTYQVNDEIFFPVYEYLEAHNIPVMLTLALMTVPYMDNNIPFYLDQVLAKFPKLNIILGHGGSPWGREFGAMAIKRKNLYLAVDTQIFRGVGYQDYAEAANYWAPDRFLFASSYPVTPHVEIKKFYEEHDVVLEKNREDFFYNNAAKLLGIQKFA